MNGWRQPNQQSSSGGRTDSHWTRISVPKTKNNNVFTIHILSVSPTFAHFLHRMCLNLSPLNYPSALFPVRPGGRPVKSTPSRGSREADRGVCTNRIPSPGALPCDAVECSRVMLWGLAVLSCGDAMTALRGRGRWALPRGLCCGGPAAKRPTFLGDDCVAGACSNVGSEMLSADDVCSAENWVINGAAR